MRRSIWLSIFGAVVALSLLGGCQSVESLGRTAETEWHALYDKCENTATNDGYESLKNKTNFFHSDQLSPAMLNLTDFADEKDRSAVSSLVKTFTECGAQFVAHAEKYDGHTAAFLVTLDVNRQLGQLRDLFNGTISWGAFNSDLQRYDRAFADAYAEVASMHWRKKYNDEQRRQMAMLAVAQGLSAYGKAYSETWRSQPATSGLKPPPNPPPYDPKTLTCQTYGQQSFCTQSSALTSPKIIRCLNSGTQMTCTEQ
jgi:hypothetical protein